MEAAIRCIGVKKGYGTSDNRIQALKGIDIDIWEGQLTIIAGASGSGKTTLISIIATVLSPDEGQVFIYGHNINKMSEKEQTLFRRKNIGVVFQSFYLIPTLTATENVALPLIVSGMAQQAAFDEAIDLLDRMHLKERGDSAPNRLSKGQQQRVAIARALVNGSRIIVCDEPTSSLDHVVGFEIMELLRKLSKDESKAVLVVTHDPRMFDYADRIINISDGEIANGAKS